MDCDSKTLRRAFGTYATGVTIVTVGGQTPHGMTANSFTTVSLDPPLILICVDRTAVMHSVLTDARQFAVSILGAQHEKEARYFADRNRPLGAEQFQQFDWVPGPKTGAPLLADALAHFECRVRRTFNGGDHSIFLARLVSLHRGQDDEALLFLRGKFRQLEPEPSEVVS